MRKDSESPFFERRIGDFVSVSAIGIFSVVEIGFQKLSPGFMKADELAFYDKQGRSVPNRSFLVNIELGNMRDGEHEGRELIY